MSKLRRCKPLEGKDIESRTLKKKLGAVLGFELRAYTLSHFTSPFFVLGIFKIGPKKLFAPASFELQSS
jgi:hypothetical protein